MSEIDAAKLNKREEKRQKNAFMWHPARIINKRKEKSMCVCVCVCARTTLFSELSKKRKRN